MKRSDNVKKGVPWTPEQIERAQEVLDIVMSLVEFDRSACGRRSVSERYMSEVLMFVWVAARDANGILARALWEAREHRVAFIDPDIVDTVRRFRAIGPTRLRDLLKQKESARRNEQEPLGRSSNGGFTDGF